MALSWRRVIFVSPVNQVLSRCVSELEITYRMQHRVSRMKTRPWMLTARWAGNAYHSSTGCLCVKQILVELQFQHRQSHFSSPWLLSDSLPDDYHTVSEVTALHLCFHFVVKWCFMSFINLISRGLTQFSSVCFLVPQYDATIQADIFVFVSFATPHTYISPHILLSDPFRASHTLYINFILLWELQF